MTRELLIRGQPLDLLQDGLVKSHAVSVDPENIQSCEHDVHMIFCTSNLLKPWHSEPLLL